MQEQLFDGKYEIIRILGRGGMGTVYLAKNVKLGALWAIKAVSKKSAHKLDLLAEPNILKRLNHPALPRIFDILEDRENIYIIEDFVEGVSLDKELKRVKRFPEETVVDLAKQICDVLIYLHTIKPNPIIYRDMKPANIIITGEGKVKLIDFGIAREYKKESKSDTSYIGTRGYAAPEQYGTAQTDARTDIYGLGVTLYHLLTGKSPNEPPYEIRPVRQFDKGFSEGIEKIIEKCTRQDPEMRYQSAGELLQDLNNIEKFNSAYKRKKLFRDLQVVFFIVLFMSFSYLTYAGVQQLKIEKIEAYEGEIERGGQLFQNKQYQEAIEVFKEASSMIPERIDSYREIGYTYLKSREYDKCISYLQQDVLNKVEDSRTDADIMYILGTAYFEKQDYNLAADYFKEAKEINPNYVNYCRDLAVSYARDGDLDRADKVLDEIKDRGMAEEVTWYVSGEILSARESFEEAVESFEKCLSITKNEELKQRAFISAADLYKKNKNSLKDALNKEIDILERAGSELREKDNIIITEMLGEAYYDRAMASQQNKSEDLKKSASNFERLLSLGYERPHIYRNIGIIYQQLEDYIKSEEVLLKMKELYKEDYRCYLQLALLYADMESKKPNQSRNYQKTYDNYQLAVKYSPEGEGTLELKPLVNLINELKKNNWIK